MAKIYTNVDNTDGAAKWERHVLASEFDANTILKADTDDTPVALELTEQTILGRLTGSISALPIGIADDDILQVDGAGTNGRVAQWTNNGLTAANLIAPANLLTLVAGGAYTLTIPATGTVALLATANVFTVPQMVDGTTDAIQLRVQRHNTQTNYIQTWEDSDATVLAGITNVGELIFQPKPYSHTSGTKYAAQGTGFFNSAGGVADTYGMLFQGLISAQSANASGTHYGLSGKIYGYRVSAGRSINKLVSILSVASGISGAGFFEGTITNATGLEIQYGAVGTGTIGTYYGINLQTASTGGTITNIYGIYLNNINTGATLNYAIYTNAGLVRFGDQLSIVGSADSNQLTVTGYTTQTDPVSHFIDNTAATNVVRNVLRLEARSTGTAAAGFGAGLGLWAETATNASYRPVGFIGAPLVTATTASYTGKLQLGAYDVAAYGAGSPRVGLEIEATGSTTTIKTFGGRIVPVTTVNAATYDLLESDDILHVTYTSTGAVTSLTLPTAQAVLGRRITIKDAGGMSSVNNITVDTDSGTIDDDSTLIIEEDYMSVTLYGFNGNWFII